MTRRGITKVRRTKWGPIVYSAVSDEGDIIRMALHPVLDHFSCSLGPPLPCRIVWDVARDAGDARAVDRWAVSCRGKDAREDGAVVNIGPLGADAAYVSERADRGEDINGNAIAWLLDGERR